MRLYKCIFICLLYSVYVPTGYACIVLGVWRTYACSYIIKRCWGRFGEKEADAILFQVAISVWLDGSRFVVMAHCLTSTYERTPHFDYSRRGSLRSLPSEEECWAKGYASDILAATECDYVAILNYVRCVRQLCDCMWFDACDYSQPSSGDLNRATFVCIAI